MKRLIIFTVITSFFCYGSTCVTRSGVRELVVIKLMRWNERQQTQQTSNYWPKTLGCDPIKSWREEFAEEMGFTCWDCETCSLPPQPGREAVGSISYALIAASAQAKNGKGEIVGKGFDGTPVDIKRTLFGLDWANTERGSFFEERIFINSEGGAEFILEFYNVPMLFAEKDLFEFYIGKKYTGVSLAAQGMVLEPYYPYCRLVKWSGYFWMVEWNHSMIDFRKGGWCTEEEWNGGGGGAGIDYDNLDCNLFEPPESGGGPLQLLIPEIEWKYPEFTHIINDKGGEIIYPLTQLPLDTNLPYDVIETKLFLVEDGNVSPIEELPIITFFPEDSNFGEGNYPTNRLPLETRNGSKVRMRQIVHYDKKIKHPLIWTQTEMLTVTDPNYFILVTTPVVCRFESINEHTAYMFVADTRWFRGGPNGEFIVAQGFCTVWPDALILILPMWSVDTNFDKEVNFIDWADVSRGRDFNLDGLIDWQDVSIFCEGWLRKI